MAQEVAGSSTGDDAPGRQDRVRIAPVLSGAPDVWADVERVTWVGQIRQFDADKLVLVQADGKVLEVASDRVESVEVAWVNSQVEAALGLVAQHRYREAITAIQEALKSGVPRWQQRFLVAALVQSADALGNPRTAGILFLNLAASSPPPLLYRDMPLCWTVREPDAGLKSKALEWLAAEEEHARLLAASWLLFSERDESARRMLLELQAAKSSAVAQLAAAQIWRTVAPPKTKAALQQWIDYRDGLLEPLQIGPTEFIADRLTRVGEVDLAIGQWMRIASVHGDRYHRAAIALQTAAKLLEREGRNDEAKRLEPWIEELTKP